MKRSLKQDGERFMKKRTSKRTISEKQMDADLDKALAAPASEAKIPIYMKLDSDLYLELKLRAQKGEGKGKYQVLINDLLRASLFGHSEAKKNELVDILMRVEKLEKAQMSNG